MKTWEGAGGALGGDSGRTNPRAGGQGINVNIQRVDLTATDQQIGAIIRTQVTEEVKKYQRRF